MAWISGKLAISQYAADRFVTVAGSVANAGRAALGMIPGCALAVRFLASFLRPTVEGIMSQRPQVTVRTYVDDLRLEAHGTPEEVTEALGRAFVDISGMLSRRTEWSWRHQKASH